MSKFKSDHYISVTVDPVLKQKARYIAREDFRSLSRHVRHLIEVDIRAYEAQHGPIPVEGEGLTKG